MYISAEYINAVECRGETSLGAYENKMNEVQRYITRVNNYGYCSPFDLNRGEEMLEKAIEDLIESIYDGSLSSGRKYDVAPVISFKKY